MLNKCPKWFSCGAYGPMWTEEVVPETIGVAIESYAYVVYKHRCKDSTYKIDVMRCSEEPHDLIYRQSRYQHAHCNYAFCGMN